jgi:uncharacterized protein
MLERDDYPAGVPCWIDTTQPDPAAAVEFYGGLFGWDLADRMPAEAPGNYHVAQLRGRDVAAIGSPPEGFRPPAVWNSYIRVDDVDATAARVRDAGGSVRAEPFDVLEAGRMAGYAEFLERYDPDLRRRHAEGGAPAGFSDSIGWMLPMTSDQFADDVPPHWHVTFSVDDTDAAAERAAKLGGEIVTEPVDAGPARLAVVRDPQGAVFTVSRYQPEG